MCVAQYMCPAFLFCAGVPACVRVMVRCVSVQHPCWQAVCYDIKCTQAVMCVFVLKTLIHQPGKLNPAMILHNRGFDS